MSLEAGREQVLLPALELRQGPRAFCAFPQVAQSQMRVPSFCCTELWETRMPAGVWVTAMLPSPSPSTSTPTHCLHLHPCQVTLSTHSLPSGSEAQQ